MGVRGCPEEVAVELLAGMGVLAHVGRCLVGVMSRMGVRGCLEEVAVGVLARVGVR